MKEKRTILTEKFRENNPIFYLTPKQYSKIGEIFRKKQEEHERKMALEKIEGYGKTLEKIKKDVGDL